MLAIRVEYLTGVCTATRRDDPTRSTPEWPPHPDRLFSALVAAAGRNTEPQTNLSDSDYRALDWLLKQKPLYLSVSKANIRLMPDVHMPTNPHEDEVWQKRKPGQPRTAQSSFEMRTLLPTHRKRAALPLPAVIPDDPAAYFIWPDANCGEYLELLRGICRRVAYLGRSRSLVLVSIVDEPPPATHVPDAFGQCQVRVAGPGRLQNLIDKHQRDGGKPDPSPPHRYRMIDAEGRTEDAMESVFDRCWVFKPKPNDPALPIVSTVKLTQTLRRALIACIEADQRERGLQSNVPDIVHGHGKHPHCAYVGLPFVHAVQPHADGSIKGLAVLVPRDTEPAALLMLARGLIRLQKNGLGIPGIGTWHLEEVPADDPLNATLDLHTWTLITRDDGSYRPARVWTTATPMVFGHFPKPNKGGEAKVVLESLHMIGIDPKSAVEIAVDRHSPLHGAVPSWFFKILGDNGRTGHQPAWIRHVTVRFERAVRGPILLGSMRYFGLGLMRPIEE